MEQAIIEARAGHLDVVGELEAALEGAARDAAMEIPGGILVLLGLAVNHELVLLDRDVEIVRAEARHRHGQAISVLAGRLDVVRRVAAGAIDARRCVGQAHQPVETNRRAEEGREIESVHNHILLKSNMGSSSRSARLGPDLAWLTRSDP